MSIKSILRHLRWQKGGLRTAPRPFRYAVLESNAGRRTFVKTYATNVRAEYERGKTLAEIGEATGIFRAPRALAIIESEGIVLWEYLDGLIEFRDFLVDDIRRNPANAARAQLFFEAGRALAAIHEGFLRLPTDGEHSPIPPPHSGHKALDLHVTDVVAKCPRRPLHWDYCCGNLLMREKVEPGFPRLAVLDPMPNFYVTQEQGPFVVSPIYVDLGQMIFSLYGHPRFSRAIAREADAFTESFLAGYAAQSSVSPDRATTFYFAAEIARFYLAYRRREGASGNFLDRRDQRFSLASARALLNRAIDAVPGASPTTPIAGAAALSARSAV